MNASIQSPDPDDVLDLRGVACPANSARALLRLEGMDSGEVLELVVDDGEPIELVPVAVEQEGHEILTREQDGRHWRLLIRAN